MIMFTQTSGPSGDLQRAADDEERQAHHREQRVDGGDDENRIGRALGQLFLEDVRKRVGDDSRRHEERCQHDTGRLSHSVPQPGQRPDRRFVVHGAQFRGRACRPQLGAHSRAALRIARGTNPACRTAVITVPAKSSLQLGRSRSRGSTAGTCVEAVVAAALALVCYPIAGSPRTRRSPSPSMPTANRHPIDPNIYGVAHATTAQLNDLNTPLNRNGGNNTTRYNWQLNADNRGNDWYYESIADSSATAGERGDTFIANARAANAKAMLTIPLIDWVAKVGPGRSKLAGFSIAKYGAQTGNDWQWFPDAGNGVRTNGQFVTGNDPNDANVPSNAVFQQGWVQHLVGRWGTNAAGGLRYYILDNEPSIWHSTHRDVRPTGATMDEIRNRMVDFAAKIKAVDPSALVVGPEEWGWSGYFYSGYDQQYGSTHGWASFRIATITAARTTCPGCSASCARAAPRRGGVCSTSSRCTTIRRAASSATTCRARCSCGATARPVRCGIRATSTRPGSTTASS